MLASRRRIRQSAGSGAHCFGQPTRIPPVFGSTGTKRGSTVEVGLLVVGVFGAVVVVVEVVVVGVCRWPGRFVRWCCNLFQSRPTTTRMLAPRVSAAEV